MVFDENLSWKYHKAQLQLKLEKKITLLRAMGVTKGMPIRIAAKAVNNFYRATLEYGTVICN